ncbi:GNAT family N-acetyltransferase [Kribbella sp. VKM Ac-2568]|uniref:GNAT family N-acetyltransferase n=1 Tax=Kribbella sp. VKM Ac-2568 TaxID=2512219 RepID=UPI00104C7710|nr:GNAT family N-acetyltransferase [Kribbella sp. VKM Ac-2568]TCM50480.1 acetyltransferase (GNAT) family protein [Kribbella sp. VKM Ac-2568]
MNAATSLSVRRASRQDAELVRTMVRELADHQDQGEHVTITVERWRELLGDDAVIVLVAEQKGQAVGYVSAFRRPHLWSGEDILALDDLYVRSDFRDAGVGRELMLELARHAQPERLTISWGMQPENVHGQRFYARLGAALRPKVVAAWNATAYTQALRD